MPRSPSIVAEKVDQAIEILKQLGIDAWLTFVRETTEAGDPVLQLILGQNLTWQSALILTSSGERIAIVGRYEDDAVKSGGVWTEVIPYVQSIREPLVETLGRIDPAALAVNFSLDDTKSDGLTHGMFLLLQQYLAGTPYGSRLVIAAQIINALRGRKTAGEVERVRAAVATAQRIIDAVGVFARPGRSELEIARYMREQATRQEAEPAWDPSQCPIVRTGPDSMPGHALPSATLVVEPGRIFHVDFGVRREGYCSDLQRAWYVPAPGEAEPPAAVRRAFDTVVRAIRAGAQALKPGVEGWQVDAAARQILCDAGYPDYQHATGHQVGRSAHDGGCVLGPRWERYGRTPYYQAEPGNVFTLELGIDNVDGRGYLGLEEMLLVTADGCAFLSSPQETLPLLR
ncbi:MAG: M24 family metallopeptidase [Planctomycetota bacterium]|jgi:Xaa-Pro aminopeptidase